MAHALFNNYLSTVLHFNVHQRNALYEQGVPDLDGLRVLSDEDIHSMCTNIRRIPLAPVPPAGRGGRGAGAAGQQASIPQVKERILKILAWYLRHLVRIQRDFDEDAVTEDFLRLAGDVKEMEEEARKKKRDIPVKMKSSANIRTTLDELDNYFMSSLAANGAPLSYVLRDSVASEEWDGDGGFVANFDSREMVAHSPHTPPFYRNNNAKVWHAIQQVMRDTEGWPWISMFKRARDGRAAYFAIKAHSLGLSSRSTIKEKAEAAIDNTYYDGNKKHFSFEKYCSIHNGAHKDLADYNDVMEEDKKVRKFLKICVQPICLQVSQQ